VPSTIRALKTDIQVALVKARAIIRIIGLTCMALCQMACFPPSYVPKDRNTRFSEYINAGLDAKLQRHYTDAEQQFKSALKVAEEQGTENMDVIIALDYLAEVYTSQHRDDEAESLFRRRIEIAKKVKVDDPELLARTYDNLAMFYLRRKRFIEARPIYLEALSIRGKAFGENDEKVLENLDFYATMLHALGQETEAAQMEARIKDIKSKRS
jgi:tetratricopeptide (TPR) repeat protein